MAIGRFLVVLAAISLAVPQMAVAQDDGVVIVTGSRSDRSDGEYYDDDQSAIGLTRKADFFVTPLYVSSDSRDETLRNQELTAMLRETITRAQAAGIALVAGDYTLRPVDANALNELSITRGRRPDTSRLLIYARLPLSSDTNGVRDADARIEAFAESIPATGRSFIETGSTVLALRNPDQYRGAVVRAIADESTRYAGLFGNDYGVEIRGLDSELYWQQASETEVFLYIAHSFVVRPK